MHYLSIPLGISKKYRIFAHKKFMYIFFITPITPKEIRNSIDNLTWKKQMETVIKQTFTTS